MNDIQEALEEDSRFDTTTLHRGVLSVDSDSWMTIIATDTEPTQVIVEETSEGLFDIRPVDNGVDCGGELLSQPAKEVVPYIKILTE